MLFGNRIPDVEGLRCTSSLRRPIPYRTWTTSTRRRVRRPAFHVHAHVLGDAVGMADCFGAEAPLRPPAMSAPRVPLVVSWGDRERLHRRHAGDRRARSTSARSVVLGGVGGSAHRVDQSGVRTVGAGRFRKFIRVAVSSCVSAYAALVV